MDNLPFLSGHRVEDARAGGERAELRARFRGGLLEALADAPRALLAELSRSFQHLIELETHACTLIPVFASFAIVEFNVSTF
jgi:hypothetical protein